MPTIRSLFSFEQFEGVLQKLAHETAIEAVTKLDQGRIRIATFESNQFKEVQAGNITFRFYLRHASYTVQSSKWEDWWGFDVEEKLYLTSNHSTKISFYAPEGKEKEVTEKITKFIDKIMADVKVVPRFSLGKYTRNKV